MTAGQGVKGFNEFIKFAEDMSPFGKCNSQMIVQSFCIAMFSDLTKMVTCKTFSILEGSATQGFLQSNENTKKNNFESFQKNHQYKSGDFLFITSKILYNIF